MFFYKFVSTKFRLKTDKCQDNDVVERDSYIFQLSVAFVVACLNSLWSLLGWEMFVMNDYRKGKLNITLCRCMCVYVRVAAVVLL